MSDVHDEETNSQISQSSESELENGYESNESDILNLDDEEEDDDRSSFRISCLPEGLLGRSLVLHIDQSSPLVPIFGSSGPTANHSTSTATSLSDAASDNVSTRAVMGDTPSTTETNALPAGEEDAADNSSQASIPDSEAERVRRIHSSIFSSLENDLAELVRIREETIQFLETGVRSGESSADPLDLANLNDPGDGGAHVDGVTEQRPNIAIRERLTYLTRPFTTGDIPLAIPPVDTITSNETIGSPLLGLAERQAQSFTPVAKFDNAPPGLPGKPYLDVGLTSCDEKAIAARKLLDKLQYGDPEDEGACFVRRFWRETTTVVDNSQSAPLSVDVAAIAQRAESLQASLEEAFDGLRLRLQQVQTDANTQLQASRTETDDGGSWGGSDNEETAALSNSANDAENEEYQRWDEETSIMNNPLNYDIWNELEEGSEAGPNITARINMAERRALASGRCRERVTAHHRRPSTTTATVGVGTDGSSDRWEGAELDDEESTEDEEEMLSNLRIRCNDFVGSTREANDSVSQESRAFFQEIGISEEMRQDLLNIFTFSEDVVNLPAELFQTEGNSEISLAEVPSPLFQRGSQEPCNHPDEGVHSPNNSQEIDPEEEPRNESGPPRIPLMDITPFIQIVANREDDCSTRVYLDEDYLNFPIAQDNDDTHNNDEPERE